MSEELSAKLSSMIIDTARAHHQYQENTFGGEYNTDWADWYSNHLIELDISGTLGRVLSHAELKALLAKCDEDYRAVDLEQKWPNYYADQIIAELLNEE